MDDKLCSSPNRILKIIEDVCYTDPSIFHSVSGPLLFLKSFPRDDIAMGAIGGVNSFWRFFHITLVNVIDY